MSKLKKVIQKLEELLEISKVDKGHGIDHALTVLFHAQNVLKYENLTEQQRTAVELASLLHDADDSKFFNTKDNFNAKTILNLFYRNKTLKNMVMVMINLVSCSKNKNNIDPNLENFYYIPRFCDRLEALGEIGLERALIYNQIINRPLYLVTTKFPKNREELYKIATKQRFENYSGNSESFIDHLYDKVLHLKVETGNIYLDTLFKIRHRIIEDYILNYKGNKVF